MKIQVFFKDVIQIEVEQVWKFREGIWVNEELLEIFVQKIFKVRFVIGSEKFR